MESIKRKEEACKELVALNSKKINKTHIIAIANKLNLKRHTVEVAWKNFQESGGKLVDRRYKSGSGAIYIDRKNPAVYTKRRSLTPEMAGAIIIEFMTSNIKSCELCNKYRIPVVQLYGMIHELETSGTLLGIRVLDPKKYAKLNMTDVIHLHKYPHSRRKSIKELSEMERCAYERVANVLINYIPQ